jgi:hypothetical protein
MVDTGVLAALIFSLICAIHETESSSTSSHSLSGHHVGGRYSFTCVYTRESETDEEMMQKQVYVAKFPFDMDFTKFLDTRIKDFSNVAFYNPMRMHHGTTPAFDDLIGRVNITEERNSTNIYVSYKLTDLRLTDDGYMGCVYEPSSRGGSYMNISGPATHVSWRWDLKVVTNVTLEEDSSQLLGLDCEIGIPNVLPDIQMYLTNEAGQRRNVTELFRTGTAYSTPYIGRENGLGDVRYRPKGFPITYKDHTSMFNCDAVSRDKWPSQPTVSAAMQVNVLFSPKELVCPYLISAPLAYGPVSIECRVLSNPLPHTYTWMLNGTAVTGTSTQNEDSSYNVTSTITLPNLAYSNIGQYSLLVTSDRGVSEKVVIKVEIGDTYIMYDTEQDFINGAESQRITLGLLAAILSCIYLTYGN